LRAAGKNVTDVARKMDVRNTLCSGDVMATIR